MAGVLIEYTRFVEVQQRRALVAAQLVQSPQGTPAEATDPTAIEKDPIAEPRREFCSMSREPADQLTRGAEDRRHTTGGSADVC